MSDNTNDTITRRLTIGLLIDNVVGEGLYHAALWSGVADAAKDRDVNVICFSGGTLTHSPFNPYESQRNIIYELATPRTVDGLVIVGTTLANFVTDEYMDDFYNRYRALPSVCIGVTRSGIPSAMIDNEQGLRHLLSHLIQEHSYKRIAFIRGPEGNEDADQRYRVYVQVLNEHGIPFDPQLVTPGNFLTETGAEAVATLLDERRVTVDAIVAANDNMAVGALDALRSRGIDIPHAVAVTGFDDLEVAQATTPSLTTVRQPIHAQGYKAAQMLIDLIRGRDIPETVLLPTELVIRQSCGCLGQATHLRQIEQEEDKTLIDALRMHREEIITALLQILQNENQTLDREQAAQLVDAFGSSLQEQNKRVFLQALEKALRNTAAQSGDVTRWQEALHILHHYTFPHLQDREMFSALTTLLLRASMWIGDFARRAQVFDRLQAARQAELLRHTGYELITSFFDVQALMEAATQSIPTLGVNRFYIALYENPQFPLEWSHLLLAHQEHGPLELEGKDPRYPTLQLLPTNLLPSDRPYHLLLDSLYLQNERMGLILFEVGPMNSIIYATLQTLISGALKGALLFQEHQKMQRELERSNKELEQFASVVSHDLQEPLRMITSYLELLESRYKDKLDSSAEEFITYTVDGAERMKRMINDLLGYSRLTTRGQPLELTNCENPLAQALSNLEIAIKDNNALITHDPLPTVMADSTQLMAVFQNLIGNAIKFHADRQPHVHISAEKRRNEWLFSVRDNGIGIVSEHMEQVFTIFSRLHPQTKYPGSGIGLAICKKVVERHGGRIWFESQPDEGTTFFFTIPTLSEIMTSRLA